MAHQLHVFLTERDHDALKAFAQEEGESVSSLVRSILRGHIRKRIEVLSGTNRSMADIKAEARSLLQEPYRSCTSSDRNR